MRRPEPSGGRGAALRAILGPVLRPVLRWGRRLALGLGGLIAVVLAGGWLWLQSGIADDDGIIVSPALSASVEVLRDAHGVPHIYADNRRDAAFALGVLHARDRLFQMEFMRRLGAGRLSEVVGTATLPLDRFMRTLGVYRLAEAQFDRLTPEHQALTESYAAGVNQVIGELNSGWSKAPPPEFVVLRYRPEPWQPADSLVWGKLMGLLLTDNWQAEMLRQEVISRLGGDAATVLWPENDAAPSTLVNDRSAVLRRHYTPGPYRGDRAHAATAPTVPSAAGQPKAGAAGSTAQLWASLANAVATALPAGPTGGASNAWVIGGGRTQPGAPILANDPHLGFSAPNLWYLAHVETPEGGWAGATVAGVPTPILAQTRDIAWGFTTSNTDAADLYILTLDPQQPDFPGFYVTPSGSAAISGRDEIIRVRGAESERLTVRQTALGPIISDLDEATRRLAVAGQVVALRATFLDADDDSPAALFALAEARSVAEAMTALERFASPAQNAMLADRHGDIGFVTTGRIPLRRNGRDGLLPADAAAVGDDWFDWLPERLRPSERNPERGYIYNANNRVLPPDAAIHLTGFSPEDGFRAARLSVLIGGSHDHELATSTA
ncbi:MAG: penicillin acylase family protein, partial [Alphaproteobacteria bacterium]